MSRRVCGVVGCGGRASVGPPGHDVSHCLAHWQDGELLQAINANVCTAPGCTQPARFGPARCPVRVCKAHRSADDVSALVGRRRCSVVGCSTQPSFGPPGGRRIHCTRHKLGNETYITAPLCTAPGCTTRAHYSAPGEKPAHCVKHKRGNEVNRYAQKCSAPGCTSYARIGHRGGNPTHCAEHKPDVLGGTPYCTNETGVSWGSTRAAWGFAALAKPIDSIKLPWQCVNCNVRASFGVRGGQPTHCAMHKRDGEINIRARWCQAPSCGARACFSQPG